MLSGKCSYISFKNKQSMNMCWWVNGFCANNQPNYSCFGFRNNQTNTYCRVQLWSGVAKCQGGLLASALPNQIEWLTLKKRQCMNNEAINCLLSAV